MHSKNKITLRTSTRWATNDENQEKNKLLFKEWKKLFNLKECLVALERL